MTIMPNADEIARDVKNALNLLQDDSKGTRALAEDTKAKVLDFMNKVEDHNQELTKKLAVEEKARTELVEKLSAAEKSAIEAKTVTDEQRKRVEHLEMLLVKGINASANKDEVARETDEYKNFFIFLKGTTKEVQDLNIKALRTDSETAGAYLIPQIMDNVIN